MQKYDDFTLNEYFECVYSCSNKNANEQSTICEQSNAWYQNILVILLFKHI